MQPGLPFEPEYPPPLFVRHPRARRYVVSVREDGRVRVTLPRWGSMREAREFAGRLDQWIERQRRKLEAERIRKPEIPDADRHDALARAKRELPARLLELATRLGL